MSYIDAIYPRIVVYAVGLTPSSGPFSIPFPFHDADTVKVYVDGVLETNVTVVQPTLFSTTGSQVTLDTPVASASVTIRSDTNPYRTISETFVISELSAEIDRLFGVMQEFKEFGVYVDDLDAALDMVARRLSNVADPVAAQDAATKAWVETVPNTTLAASVAAQTAAELAQTLAEAAQAAAESAADVLEIANNLSDLADAPTALINLGLTATAAELNYSDGVTSNIQTQLDAAKSGSYRLVATATGFTTQAEAIHTFTAQDALDYDDYQLRVNNLSVNTSAGAGPGILWTEKIGIKFSGDTTNHSGSYLRIRSTVNESFSAAAAGGSIVFGEGYGSDQANGLSGSIDIYNLHDAGVQTKITYKSQTKAETFFGGGVRGVATAETSISITSDVTAFQGGTVELWGRLK